MANKTREFYLTEDLHLTAYLIASGKADLREIVGTSYSKKSFKLFPLPSEKELSEFYTGLAKVSERCRRRVTTVWPRYAGYTIKLKRFSSR